MEVRPQHLKRVVLTAAFALGLAGCAVDSKVTTDPGPVATPAISVSAAAAPKPPESTPKQEPTPTSQTGLIDSAITLVNERNPELKAGGLEARSANVIRTNYSAPATVLNYTDMPLNLQSAQRIYDTIEIFGLKDSPIQYSPYSYKGKDRFLHFKLELFKKRILLVLPNKAPKDPKGVSGYDGITRSNGDGSVISEIWVASGANPAGAATFPFSTEVCQQTINVEPVTVNHKEPVPGKPGFENVFYDLVTDSRETQIAQEIGCNSLGNAVALKAGPNPYNEYLKIEKDRKWDDEATFPIYSRDVYNNKIQKQEVVLSAENS